MSLKYLLAAASVILPIVLAPAAFADPNEVALGRERAIEYCAGCHQVTRQQARPEPVPFPEENSGVVTPSFAAISAKYDGHEKELRAYIKAPTHPMKEQQFLESDLNAIIAYIMTAEKNW